MTDTTATVQSPAPEPAPAQAPQAPASPPPQSPPQAPDQAPAGDQQRPAWLPPKFKDAEQLAKAYAELEKRLGGQPAKDTQPQKPGAADRAEPTTQEQLAIRQAGLDADALADEFLRTGKVSDESYAKAEKLGLNKAFVDNFVAGQAALVERQTAELYSEVGGQEEFAKVSAWAKANLSAREIAAIDQATQNGSMDLAKIALRGLFARYQAAVGRAPNLVSGEPANANTGYRSQAEVTAAMRDRRYSTDPAYRAEVEARLRAGSPFQVRAVGY